MLKLLKEVAIVDLKGQMCSKFCRQSSPFLLNSSIKADNCLAFNHNKWLHTFAAKVLKRSLSTETSTNMSIEKMGVETTDIETQELMAFDETYRRILTDIVQLKSGLSSPSELGEVFVWLDKVVQYNVPKGKRNRGLALVMSYRLLASREDQTNDNLELARTLGWCVELLQAYFLIIDDLVDQSITRRGQLCWYRQESVGLIACNDAILLETSIYHILKTHFINKSYYCDILNLFLEVTRFTSYGQCLDLLSNPPGKKPDFNSFSLERYAAIVKYKTAYYSFCLPVRIAMYMSNWSQTSSHLAAEKILLKMGHFFQVQDDFLDCFGDPEIIGKIGTDIEDGKCSWLVVNALLFATSDQRKILQDNYGLHNTESVARVKAIYNQLNIESLYREYEENTYNEICQLIKEVSITSNLPANIFYGFLSKIHRRVK